jgi:hypothetical protein
MPTCPGFLCSPRGQPKHKSGTPEGPTPLHTAATAKSKMADGWRPAARPVTGRRASDGPILMGNISSKSCSLGTGKSGRTVDLNIQYLNADLAYLNSENAFEIRSVKLTGNGFKLSQTETMTPFDLNSVEAISHYQTDAVDSNFIKRTEILLTSNLSSQFATLFVLKLFKKTVLQLSQ